MKYLIVLLIAIRCTTGFAQHLADLREADRLEAEAEEARINRAFDRAVKLLSQVIARDPGRQETYLLLAQNREQTTDWKAALTDYNVYLEWQPTHFEARWARAMLLVRMKDWPAARTDLLRLLQLPAGETTHVFFEMDPHDNRVRRALTSHRGARPQIYNYLGVTALELHDYATAIAYLDTAILLAPAYGEAYSNRGMAHEKAGHAQAARSDLSRAIALQPELEVAQHNLAIVASESNAATSHVEALSQLIDRSPKIPYPYYERAAEYVQMQRYTDALGDINQAIQLDSVNESYWVLRGIIREKQKQWKLALRDYLRAIQLNDQWAEAWFHHGNVARQLADRTTALEDYTMAIHLKSDYGRAYYNRAITFYEAGDYRSACADVQRASELGIRADPRLVEKVCKK
jgi:tetratricopeptide (TPR) repeat protein